MSEPADRGANGAHPSEGAKPGADPSLHGEIEPYDEEVRHLPVPVEAPEPRPIERRAPALLPAPIIAAAGGFLAGVAAFVLLRVVRRRRSGRSPLARARDKRGREIEVAGSRSFLVDVHLLKR